MLINRLLPGLLAFLAANPALNAADAAPTYQVNLNPPWKVGVKFTSLSDSTAKIHSDSNISAPTLPAPQDKISDEVRSVHFEAEGEVLSLQPNGDVQKLALTLKALKVVVNDVLAGGMPKLGVLILAEKTPDGITKYSINGQPASADVTQLLDSAVWLNDGKSTLQDDFGYNQAVPQGATWAANPAGIIEDAKKTFGDASSAKGTVKLDNVQGDGDSRIFNVSGQFTVQGVKSPLPEQIASSPVDFQVKLTGSYPTATKGVLKQTEVMTFKVTGTGTIPLPVATGAPLTNAQLKIDFYADGVDTHQITFR